MVPNLEALKAKLEKLAKEETIYDAMEASGFDGSVTVNDYAGGNMDDAHQRGLDDGRVDLAREILKEFFEQDVAKIGE
jgi:hypothetical protein